MAKRGNIFYTDKDFTDSEVQQQFGFPVILILHDNNSVIKKISAFDENGIKCIYDFSLSASKQFVTDSIATAISNIKDNTLEFPTFADFPQPGEVGNVYIDLAEDKIYIWDSTSSTYISQSWNQTIITSIQTQITALQNNKLDKGTYTGTAQDLKNNIDNIQIGGRNFLRNSKNFAGLTNWNINGNPVITQNDDSITLDLPENTVSVGMWQPLDLGGYIGDITISFDALSTNAGWNADLSIGIEGKTAKIGFGINDVTTWTRFSFTLNLSTATNSCVFIFYKGNNAYPLGIKLRNIKLEKGNKATDWTPAPEDKQDSLQNITGYIGVGKTDDSATEKLDVNGRTKSDGIIINETTSAILPKEIKFKDGKFKAALVDGVEKSVLLDGDVSGFDFNSLIDIFQYSNFQFIRPSFNTTSYFQYNQDGDNIFQAGQVAYYDSNPYQRHGIQYKSATTTLGRCHGNFRGYIEKHSYSSFNTSVQFAITSNIATQRVFVGYSDIWRQPNINPFNVAMNTLVDVIGVCMESGSSNLFIIYNDASGVANLIDTGFTHSTSYLYILRISKKVNSTIINVVLERVLMSTGVKSTFSYDITNNYTTYGGYLVMYCIDKLGVSETSIVDFGSLKTKRLNYLV